MMAEYDTLRQRYLKAPALLVYQKAYHHKVVLTVLSTVVALVPFLPYGQQEALWFALGVGTNGGLMMSLVVIVRYLPLLLGVSALPRAGQRARQRRAGQV